MSRFCLTEELRTDRVILMNKMTAELYDALKFDYRWTAAELSDYEEAMYDQRCCSICDGAGHGYPGAGPCPLEERGSYDAREDYDAHYQSIS